MVVTIPTLGLDKFSNELMAGWYGFDTELSLRSCASRKAGCADGGSVVGFFTDFLFFGSAGSPGLGPDLFVVGDGESDSIIITATITAATNTPNPIQTGLLDFLVLAMRVLCEAPTPLVDFAPSFLRFLTGMVINVVDA